MAVGLVALGSNLGDRAAALDRAVALLDSDDALRHVAVSRYHETPPIGGPAGQPPFLNAAVRLETSLSPHALLAHLQSIEAALGRQRSQRWAARTLDLDLLLYDDVVLDSPELTLPHPRMAWRRFVLEPAAEVAADMRHPQIGWTVAELLAHLNESVPYVALAGPPGVGKTELATALARRLDARRLLESLDEGQLATFYADPASRAWTTELEFLAQRETLLDEAAWPRDLLTVSDFWFEQSLAFAEVWLEATAYRHFEAQWREASRRVVRPKLLVLLDVELDELQRRIARRARPYESSLDRPRLQRLREALLRRATRRGLGPVLRLVADEHALGEIVAAVQAMQ